MTITAVTNASRYDWPTWFIGIMRSFLSGGSAALFTGTGGAVLGVPGPMVWKLMGINFILMGLYRMGEFLQLHGAPDKLQQALEVAAEATKAAQAETNKAVSAVAEAKAIAPEAPKKTGE